MEEKEIVLEETKEEVKGETSEKKSGGNKVLIIIIVVLLLVIAVGFGYFLGSGKTNSNDKEADKVVDENKEEEKEEEKIENTDKDDAEEVKIEQLTKDSAVVKKLYDVFKEVENDMYDPGEDYDLTKDNVKKSYALRQLMRENKTTKKTCGSLSEVYVNDAFCSPYNLVYNEKTGEIDYAKSAELSKNDKVDTYSPSDLKAKYLELFGQDAKFIDGDFELSTYPCGYAYYDKNNNLYAHYSYGCGGVVMDATQTLDSIKQEGTSLVLYTTLKEVEKPAKKIEYVFEYEKATGNYIFVSRVEK